MTTQDQKNKKIQLAERQVTDVQAKVTKKEEALRKLEADYTEAKNKLTAELEALRPELAEVQEHLTWTRAMPVSKRASGEVGAVETPVADAAE
jgi:DNA repair exonuclease SbcCD ATPase subunit